MSFEEYLAAQQHNIEQLRRLPHFTDLVLPVHDLYDRGIQLVPRSSAPIFGRLLLLSHRNFLSAATLALRAIPDDAAAVTRRAVEAARTALAFKHDPENLQRWTVYTERIARWAHRRQSLKPPGPLNLQMTYPPDHDLGNRLAQFFGILSDGAAHFTPEFVSQQIWSVVDDPDTPTLGLSYFSDREAVELGVARLVAAHLLCLAAFDECYDGTFSADPGWGAVRTTIQDAASRLAPPPSEAREEEP